MISYHIELRSYRIIGWVDFIVCITCAVMACWSEQCWPAMGFAIFSVLGLYLALGAGNYDIDTNGITHKSSFGTWRIQWDEIASVEIGEVDGTLVFHGSNKRFILAPPTVWAGPDKHNALDLVIEQLESRNLSPKFSRTTAYKIMKNTRVDTKFQSK
jgi:hypothetical protein